MRAKSKAQATEKRRTTPASRPDEAIYSEMEKELERLTTELKNLEKLNQRAPSRQTRKALLDMEEAVVQLEERIIAFLKQRPKLAARVKRPDPLPVKEHLSEQEWREKLRKQQENLENTSLDSFRKEHDRRQHEWRKSERVRIAEQERKLMDAIADRQAKLEDEWQRRRKHETETQALAWLREQQHQVARQLQDGMACIRQEMEDRETQWQQQARRELAELEQEWRAERNRELQSLEAAWREQELLHRERAYLLHIEADMRATQKSMLEELAVKWKAEFDQSQQQLLEARLQEQEKQWATTRRGWLDNFAKQALSTLREEMVSDLTSMGSEWMARQQQICQEFLDSMHAQSAAERQELRLEWESLWGEIKAASVAEHAKTMDSLHSDYQAKVTGWLSSASEQQEAMWQYSVSDWMSRSSKVVEDFLKGCQEQFDSSVQEMVSGQHDYISQATPIIVGDRVNVELSRWHETLSQELQGRYQQRTAELERDFGDLSSEWRDRQSELAKQMLTLWLEKEQQALRHTHSAEINRQRAEAMSVLNSYGNELLAEWGARQSEYLAKLRTEVDLQLGTQTSGMDERLRELTSSYYQRLQQDLSSHVERLVDVAQASVVEQMVALQEEGLAAIKSVLESKVLEVEQESIRQHQQEIEILGQELRLDFKRVLEDTESQREAEQAKRLAGMAEEYKQSFGAELSRSQDRMVELHNKALEDLSARWLNESISQLNQLSTDLRVEEQNALNALQEKLIGEYQSALRIAAVEDGVKRQVRDEELLDELTARLNEISQAWGQKHEERLQDMERLLNQGYQEHLSAHEATLLDKHRVKLEEEYDKWLSHCSHQVAETRDQLVGELKERVSELEGHMVSIYQQRLETLKGEMYLDYRSRLGKLVEDLTERFRGELAKR